MAYRILITAPCISDSGMQLLKARNVTVDTMPLGSSPDAVAEKVKLFQPDGIISRTSIIDATTLALAHNLKAISKHGTGVDNIDIKTATTMGIPVACTFGVNAQSVAEHTAALMLTVGKHLVNIDIATKQGLWPRSSFIGMEFHGRTLGLLGYGEIASKFAAIARGIGMKIVAYSPSISRGNIPPGVEAAESLQALFSFSDVISLHCPLNENTRNLINADLIKLMPKTGIIINTSRGAIIKETDLINALNNKLIAGAALDTFEVEPLPSNSPFFSMSNVVITPHLASATIEAREKVSIEAVNNLFALLDGTSLPKRNMVT